VARFVLLDSGPLGLACSRPGIALVDQCHIWLLALKASAFEIVIPAIADYEVRRELIRINATTKLQNLDDLRTACMFQSIEKEALDRAAEFWAIVRQQGQPTASADDLDTDAILAGMATTIGQPNEQVTLATTNVEHLARFPRIDARDWTTVS